MNQDKTGLTKLNKVNKDDFERLADVIGLKDEAKKKLLELAKKNDQGRDSTKV